MYEWLLHKSLFNSLACTLKLCVFMIITFYSSGDMVQMLSDFCRESPGRSVKNRLIQKFESTDSVTDNKKILKDSGIGV